MRRRTTGVRQGMPNDRRVSLRLTSDESATLDALTEQLGTTLSGAMRHLIAEWGRTLELRARVENLEAGLGEVRRLAEENRRVSEEARKAAVIGYSVGYRLLMKVYGEEEAKELYGKAHRTAEQIVARQDGRSD